MIYIICEDSKAGFKFWKEWCGFYLTSSFKCETSGGMPNMYNMVSELPLTINDTLILAVDYTKTQIFYTHFLNLTSYIEKLGITFYYTEYYCFESWMLTFSDLVSWAQSKNKTIINIRNNVNNAIRSSQKIAVEEIPGLVTATETNVEFFCSQLLMALTSESRGRFLIIKKKFGKCWYMDCKSINIYGLKSIYCINCPLHNMYKSGSEKLKYTVNNSIELFNEDLDAILIKCNS
jgi:hypothetical protein